MQAVRLTICIICLVFILIPSAASAAVVTFSDPNLEAVIRQAISKPAGDILDSDLLGLITLDAHGAGIANISGIQYCTSLTALDLQYNQIVDVSPLAGLASLWWLNLNSNRIMDVGPLAGLANLAWLELGWNQVADMSPLADLSNLTQLYLQGNQIADVSSLAPMSNLNTLMLAANQIVDVSPLAGLTNLTQLYLQENQIADLSPLAFLLNLNMLMLFYNQIVDVSALLDNSGLGAGDTIYISDNPLSARACVDIDILEGRGVAVGHDACIAYMIGVSASPLAGGSASGGGIVKDGDSVTVIATANAGYVFVNWTEGGVVATSSASYSFTASEDRDLVANFAPVPTTGTIESLQVVPCVIGGHKTHGIVILSAPAPAGGTTVLLASSNVAVLRVPASIVIPAGHRQALFPASTSNVKETTTVSVMAGSGKSQKSRAVKVIPRRWWM